MDERSLAEALLSGRVRIIGVRQTYEDGPRIRMTAEIRVEMLEYGESDTARRRRSYGYPEVLQKLMTVDKFPEPKPDPKLCLEKLIKLTQIAVLAWADSLDDSTKRVAMLDMK